ncbi:flagellar filament capping protein FliD [Thermodesulfovibrionales bacterium]|nr:flagellar filament capping protein FliD [Thermodesulfovibrionales bacterium]
MAIALDKGIFSGLDTERIIEQLMAIRNRPLERLDHQRSFYEVKISSYGSISATLSALDASMASLKRGAILPIGATSSDESVFTAAATASAAEATYSIKVNHTAARQSIHSIGFTTEQDAVAALTATHPTQVLRIQVGSNPHADITIDSTNNTLAGVRDAINGAGAGVRATVINDGADLRLILSAEETGAANKIVVQVDENNDGHFAQAQAGETDMTGLSRLAFDAIDGITNMTESVPARDASLDIEGLTVTRPSNTIDDLIAGVTINLLSDSAGKTLTLTVAKDKAQAVSNIDSFVAAYNSAIGLMRELSVPVAGEGKVLTGSSTVRAIMADLSAAITASHAGESPVNLGLSFDRVGVLSFSASPFKAALRDNPEGVIDTFDAMARSFKERLDMHMDTMIPARENGLNNSIEAITGKIDRMEMRLETVEMSYRQRFMFLEQILGQLQVQSDFLAQQVPVMQMGRGGRGW